MGAEQPLTSTQRSARRRAMLRARGMKPRTLWLLDRDSAAYREQTRSDVAIINEMRCGSDTMAFVEAVQYWPEKEYDWGPEGPP